MVATGSRWVERRRDVRVRASGSVVVHSAGRCCGRTVDVSSGGVRIRLARGAARCRPGDPVTLDLHLDDRGATWLGFTGAVTRVAGDRLVSIAFTAVPETFTDVLRAAADDARAAAAGPQVLLVDGDRARRTLVGCALRMAGCTVEEAATPLEAISVLCVGGARQWLVMIADTLPSSIADELRRHVARHHPGARLLPLPLSPEGATTE